MRLPRNAHSPVPTALTRDEIFARAASFAAEIGFSVGTPAASLLERMGGQIGLMNGLVDVAVGLMPSDRSDCLVVYGQADFVVLLKPSDNPDLPRANLEIAKAIGHYVLHTPMVREKYGPDAGLIVGHYPKSKDEEQCQREALQFAYGLLAPIKRLSQEWERAGGDLLTLRETFRLPPDLIQALYENCANSAA